MADAVYFLVGIAVYKEKAANAILSKMLSDG